MSTTTDQPEVPEVEETPDPTSEPDTTDTPTDEQPEQDTFPREYVERLRQENGKYRQRAADRDALAQRLHTALVAASGRLADPEDLPYDPTNLEDTQALDQAITALLERKPHLASRKPHGSVGQGAGGSSATVDLAGILRSRA